MKPSHKHPETFQELMEDTYGAPGSKGRQQFYHRLVSHHFRELSPGPRTWFLKLLLWVSPTYFLSRKKVQRLITRLNQAEAPTYQGAQGVVHETRTGSKDCLIYLDRYPHQPMAAIFQDVPLTKGTRIVVMGEQLGRLIIRAVLVRA
ncbi:MAG: hypothetical protein AAFR61_08280 [Bacteroidota bacterium]